MSKDSLHVLLIEDTDADAFLIERMLVQNNVCDVRVTRARSLAEAFNHLQEDGIEVAILDLHLPDSDGIDSLHQLHAFDSRLPVVLLTGANDDDIALDAIAHGAQEFLSKHALIPAQLVRTLLFAKMRQSKMLGWKAAAEVDFLTGLNNRRELLRRFDVEQDYIGEGEAVCLAVLDVDNFKEFNDQFGHLCGDAILAQLGKTLAEEFTDGNAFRYGGEEFLVILRQASFELATQQLESLIDQISKSELVVDEIRLRITVSVGITDVNPTESFQTAFSRCDEALYSAKLAGRNRLVVLRASS